MRQAGSRRTRARLRNSRHSRAISKAPIADARSPRYAQAMNKEQQSLCKRYGARFMPLDDIYKAAFRKTLCPGAYPSTACVIRLKAKPEVGLSAQVSIRTMTFFPTSTCSSSCQRLSRQAGDSWSRRNMRMYGSIAPCSTPKRTVSNPHLGHSANVRSRFVYFQCMETA